MRGQEGVEKRLPVFFGFTLGGALLGRLSLGLLFELSDAGSLPAWGLLPGIYLVSVIVWALFRFLHALAVGRNGTLPPGTILLLVLPILLSVLTGMAMGALSSGSLLGAETGIGLLGFGLLLRPAGTRDLLVVDLGRR